MNNENGQEKMKKPIYKKWWFWVLLVLVVGIIATATGGGSNDKEKDTGNNTEVEQEKTADKDNKKSEDEQKETETEDLSEVATEYTLTAGNYTAGIDLPVGTCNLTAVSGTGNVSSSNMFNGGLNEKFGIDDGNGYYTSDFTGLKMEEKVELKISGDVTVQVSYTEVTGNMTGRSYDDAATVELGSGNYTAGTDFEPGVYTITAVSGTGNLSSSNMYDGGVNEVFGVDDGSGLYVPEIKNVVLDENVTLTIGGGVSIKMVPAVE